MQSKQRKKRSTSFYLQGHTLFQTHDNREHLAMMAKILGQEMPQHLARRSRTKYFKRVDAETGQLILDWDPKAPEAKYINQNCKPLQEYAKLSHNKSLRAVEEALFDLVRLTCEYDPASRITLKESLKHDFFGSLAPANHILRLQI